MAPLRDAPLSVRLEAAAIVLAVVVIVLVGPAV